MSRFRGHIERRLFNAVLVVLAACDHSMDAQSPPQPVANPTPDAATAVAPLVVDASVAPVDAVVATVPGDPKVLCAKYKRRPPGDRKQAKQGPPPPEGEPVNNTAYTDPRTGLAECTFVLERVPGKVTVMYEGQWCPQGGGTRPPPYAREVPGEKVLIERASIRADGTVANSELAWTAFGVVDEPRHDCGRRFEGLELEETTCDEPGAQLAAMAELEAASVPAFDRLARELAMWGAPEDLVERSWRAMRDEIRHARVMSALAREHGHSPRAIEVPALPCRSLEAIAHENAIEGCVREAYGALIATYQAERARPALRTAFRAIAVDERRHAELAEDVHAWILGRLEAAPRVAIELARKRAEVELRERLKRSRACSELGLPGGVAAVALCDAYFA